MQDLGTGESPRFYMQGARLATLSAQPRHSLRVSPTLPFLHIHVVVHVITQTC